MGLLLSGYVLEPPRVGASNSPFTYTPDTKVSDQGAFDTAYPSDESAPRTDYIVFVRVDGDLPDARFCWTKNEVISRAGYDGRNQRFKPLPGAAPTDVGTVTPSANTTRLKVTPPTSTDFGAFPIRLSVGSGSGTPFTITAVADESSFGSPSSGTVELALDTGAINWATADLTTYTGQVARFQRQSFYTFEESKGLLGVIDDVLLLNPIPGAGQFPLLRVGFDEWLTPIERADEGAFSVTPTSGTVEWARTSGRLKFNPGDLSTNTGRPVYYDGSCFAFSAQLTAILFGTVNSPGVFSPLPPAEADTFFTVPGVVQFGRTTLVDTLSTFGRTGTVEIRKSDGQIRFSAADRAAYGAQAVRAYVADLTIERGMVLRLRRSPVDPQATDPSVKDVAAFYEAEGAVLADPIIGAPKVLLPAVPVEGAPITVTVEQGTGTFVGTLPRLDVPSPPSGYGFVLDFLTQELRYGRHRSNIVVPQSARRPYGSVQLPDPMVMSQGLVLELETAPGSSIYSPLTLDEDVTFDLNSGVATLTDTVGEVLVSSSTGSFSGTTFTDTTVNFTTAGVVTGDLLVVRSGTSKGVYTIGTVGTTTLTTDLPGTAESNLTYEVRHGSETLADRFFKDIAPLDPNTRVERLVSLGAATNSPRLLIPVDRIGVSRFRQGSTTFLTTVQVANDGAFTAPATGTVQVSLSTGHLNFATADLGQTTFWARSLALGSDFRVQAPLGFVQLTERLLQNEEVFIRYAVLDDADNKVVVEERATFSVRKEITEHPVATNTIAFNPLGRELATTPPARAHRGGRPQVTGQQVTFNYTNATVTFLPDSQKTDALPHGAIVQPSERVYVDYSIYGAIGGEDSFTVSRPPMLGVVVLIQDEATSFTIAGDRTADFPINHLLRVDKADVYLLGSPTYDAGSDTTTVHLASTQAFKADFQNPALAVTSGPTRTASVLFSPSYFVTELGAYDVVPRGSKTLKLTGDRTGTYVGGVVIHWTDGSDIFDFNIVEGSSYDVTSNRTVVVLASGGMRQYGPSGITLKRSSNPILSSAATVVSTNRSPILSLPVLVFRRVDGVKGVILTSPDDYAIDASGRVTFATPLQQNEALSIAYTGAAVITDGRDFRASYTHVIVPDTNNGLVGQVLIMDYTTYAPDSFYWRVETITTFRSELAQQYNADAQATIPSGGPRLQNAAGAKLYKQGRESLYFQEGHLANEDLVARATLKFYNDGVNYLEDALRSLDGRVIGDADGPLVFDGIVDNPQRNTLAEVTNQIDDVLKVLEGPVTVTYPPFAVTFGGTYKPMYQPSKYSRFYPTKRRLFGIAADGTSLATGDTILDLGFQGLAAVNSVARRQPWAVVTRRASMGDTVIQVDNADGALDLYRPPFEPPTYDHKVAIVAQNGTVIVSAASGGVGVASKTTTSLTLSGGLPADVPVGATIYQVRTDPSPPAAPFPKFYRLGYDVGVKLDDGVLTHIEPYPPFDGTAPGVPVELEITNPPGGEALDVAADLFNQLTEPYRFSALDGGTLDDDGNRSFPILNPSVDSEGGPTVGYIYLERAIIQTGTGTLRTATTAPYVGTGALDATRTIITNSGPWSAPIPKVHDLVEIRTGLNALSGYYRITAVGGSTITVATAFPSVDAGFTFTVTVSNTLVTSVGTFGLTTLTDVGTDFITATVKPGHTVVVTSGANTGLRRQVVSVDSPTQLTITSLPVGGVASYRVDDSLATFGGTSSILTDLVAALDGELQVLDTNVRPAKPYSEQEGIERFFTQFFTNVATGATGQTVGGATFQDLSADFVTAGVEPGHFLYIRSSAVSGIYQVDTVNSATSLDMTEAFAAPVSGITYAVVKAEGLALQALQDVFSVLAKVDDAITSATALRTIVATAVAVAGDAGAFAQRLLKTDLDVREINVGDRITDLTDPGTGSPVVLSEVMSSSGRLYDKRYTWIDARINLEKGILTKQLRAVADRKKAEKEIVKQLTKLLTTQP